MTELNYDKKYFHSVVIYNMSEKKATVSKLLYYIYSSSSSV